jgi:AcrR family transcriptional regulator
LKRPGRQAQRSRRRAPPAKAAKARTPAQESLRALRRTQIVEAARGLVAAAGLEALTVGALEQALGFSRGVITYHFRDKDEIVSAVLASAVEEIDASTRERLQEGPGAQGASPLEQAVRAVLGTKVRGFLSRREAGLILVSFWSRARQDGPLRGAVAALYARYRAQSDRLIGLARRERGSCPARPGPFGALLVGVVIGLVLQAFFDPSVNLDEAMEEAARALLAWLAPGAAAAPPPPARGSGSLRSRPRAV